MAKGPGWYPDPWGGVGYRWWDGKNWTEHVQGQPGVGFNDVPTMRGGPLIQPGGGTPWYYQWWFIGLMLFVCCWPAGVVLTWTKPGTPATMKLIVTAVWLGIQILLAAAIYSQYPEVYGR